MDKFIKNKWKNTFCIFAIVLLPYAGAANINIKNAICHPSKKYYDNNEPASFPSSNNLLSKVGEVINIRGRSIAIYGKVFDAACIPLSNAEVYIWQVDSIGKYQYIPLRKQHDKHLFKSKATSTFQGAGTTFTNNNGEFFFITLYPAKIKGEKSPYVNIRVTYQDKEPFQTKLFFNKNIRPVSKVESLNLTAESIYKFYITLPVIQDYKM